YPDTYPHPARDVQSPDPRTGNPPLRYPTTLAAEGTPRKAASCAPIEISLGQERSRRRLRPQTTRGGSSPQLLDLDVSIIDRPTFRLQANISFGRKRIRTFVD